MWKSIAVGGNISNRIARQILNLIDAEALKPGDRLPAERDLAALLGVSRPSVREAVKTLEAQGRLHVRHGQGVFVATPQSQANLRTALAEQEVTLGELFAMREVLEVPAAGWAAGTADEARIAAAAAALEDLNRAIHANPADYVMLQKLDAAFHLRIVEAADNRFLRQTLGVLQEMLAAGMETTLLVPGRLERSRQEHQDILQALLAHDAPAARSAARRHVRATHTVARRRIRSERHDGGHARSPQQDMAVPAGRTADLPLSGQDRCVPVRGTGPGLRGQSRWL